MFKRTTKCSFRNDLWTPKYLIEFGEFLALKYGICMVAIIQL